MTPKLFTRAGLAACAASALVTLSTKASHAEQFTLFDVTFTMTWEDAINSTPSKSHHYVKSNDLNPQRPTNWITPIDYRTGKVHIFLEVLEKPEGGQKQGWALCYVGGGGYGCPYTKYYTEKGVYENEVDMTSFYNNNQIGWTQGISEVDLIYTINDSGSGHVHYFPELKDKTTPTKVRIAMVQVSKGATYDPSLLPGGTMGMGGAGGMGAGGAAGAAGTGGLAGGGNGGTGGTGDSAGSTAGGSGGVAAGGGPAAGGAGSSGVFPTAGTGVAAAGMPAATGGSGPVASATSDDAGGCAFSPGKAGGSWGWLGLGALGLWLARRKSAKFQRN